MKTYAHYDSEGNIRSLVAVSAPDGAGVMLTPKPGLSVAEVEGLELKSENPGVEELREIADTYKVSLTARPIQLVKKAEPKAG